MLYDLPFRSDDFSDGEFVCWMRDMHSGPGHIQEWGYDLGGVRSHSDDTDSGWHEHDHFPGHVDPEPSASEAEMEAKRREWNEHWYLYDKPIYAMRAGSVIAGWRNAPENGKSGDHPKVDEGRIYGGGNGMWIQHDDGSLCEYAHMIPGSVPSELVPHDEKYLPQPAASPAVEDCWAQIYIPAGQQVKVEQGQFLGRVGNSGTSGNPHLHVHVESGSTISATAKVAGSAQQMTFKRGLASLNEADPEWSPFAGSPIPHGDTGRLIWPPRDIRKEYARHGMNVTGFQDLFTHLADSGYELAWLDTYSVGSSLYANHVWHPVSGNWRAHVLQDLATHEKNIQLAEVDGHRPTLIESSVSGGKIWYSAVLREVPKEPYILEHGVREARLVELMTDAVSQNLSPVCVPVTSLNGERSHSPLFRRVDIGGWEIKNRISESGFQDEFDRQDAAGRWPVYMCAYMHEGDPYLSVVFAEKPNGPTHIQHGMSAGTYQSAWEANVGNGMVTAMVTAFDGAKTTHRWAARWWQD